MYKMRNADLVLISAWVLSIPFKMHGWFYLLTFIIAWIYNAMTQPAHATPTNEGEIL